MSLVAEKQKIKIISESGFDILDVDCFIRKCFDNKLIVSALPTSKMNFAEFEVGYEIDAKVYTPKGIVVFKSEVLKIISESELEIMYSQQSAKVEDIRQNPRYNVDCPITIFRPLQGNIETKSIDISIRGLRFYSSVSLDVNSEFEIMLKLSDTIGKIIFTGRVLDKTGLSEGVHRMIIEDISYADRQKLVDYCMSLA